MRYEITVDGETYAVSTMDNILDDVNIFYITPNGLSDNEDDLPNNYNQHVKAIQQYLKTSVENKNMKVTKITNQEYSY